MREQLMTNIETILPPAVRSEIIMVGMVKRWLQEVLPASERLQLLQFLAGALRVCGVKDTIAETVVTAIEPMGDIGAEIVTTAMRVDAGAEQCRTAFGILESDEVFNNLVCLSPSIGKAIGLLWAAPTAA
jgi:hypothetical protein